MLNVLNSNDLYGSLMLPKLLLNGFELIENDTFIKDFIKVYEENSESFTLSSNRHEIFLTIMVAAK